MMKKYHTFLVWVFVIISISCKNQSGRQSIETPRSFSTSDASKLFFRNVRKIFYDLEEQQSTKLRIYRIKTRPKRTDYPVINLALVENWRYDEAYLIIEPEGALEMDMDKKIEIHWQDSGSGQSGVYVFNKTGNKTEHVKFASEIYQSIMKNHQLHYVHQEESLPILNDEKDRESFRIMVEDYYRLVGVL
ncbi:MAG: hypothetical protein NW226_18410 [Microscillaceae bacterium]|nr:hypothetical protein [Microscillaceae bacterium]